MRGPTRPRSARAGPGRPSCCRPPARRSTARGRNRARAVRAAPRRLLARQRVREEEPQQRLVAVLDRRLGAEQPLLERLAPGGGQLEDPPPAPAVRRVLALDQALLLEPAQLRVYLPVTGRPEEPGRT